MDNVNINGDIPIATEEINGAHYQKMIVVDNIADIAIKFIKGVISRFTFDASGQLRVGGSIGVSSLPTLTTVTSITQSNNSFGDMGKTSAAMLVSQQNFMCGNRRNFV